MTKEDRCVYTNRKYYTNFVGNKCVYRREQICISSEMNPLSLMVAKLQNGFSRSQSCWFGAMWKTGTFGPTLASFCGRRKSP